MSIPVWTAGEILTADDVNNWFVPQLAIKPATQAVTSSTTLVVDNDLYLPVTSGENYLFTCQLFFYGNTEGSGDLKWAWDIPTDLAMQYHVLAAPTSGSTVLGYKAYNQSQTGTAGSETEATLCAVTMLGVVFCPDTSGLLQLTWAQNTCNSNSTTLETGSYMTLRRIA